MPQVSYQKFKTEIVKNTSTKMMEICILILRIYCYIVTIVIVCIMSVAIYDFRLHKISPCRHYVHLKMSVHARVAYW